jgi:hypothetical protein
VRIPGLGYPFLGLAGSSSGGDHIDELAFVFHSDPPFRLVGIADQLAGDI